jgi:hypothetical protein
MPCPVNRKGTDMQSKTMKHQVSRESVSLLHELDLGQHTLFIMSDGSIDVLAHDEHTSSLADHGIRLDDEETYRLFISLHEQFQQAGAQLFPCTAQTQHREVQ